jgi:peroxiredoxin (alkyl hydroperoxide reductase subunit C)
MYRHLLTSAVMVALTTAPALAALSVGASAPDFSAQASMGGKDFTFNLADALKKGPVVLYFYPAAFTKGCSLEARTFADAMDQFKALHATVIGVSHDNIGKLNKFSVSYCRSKFPVAADPSLTVAKQYDAVLPQDPTYANRTSYVIAPDGKILATMTDLEHPQQHVENALSVLKHYESSQKTQ